MNTSASERLWEEAKRLIPGGVNSPVRAFRAVGGTPLFIERGEGAYLYDVDGNRYMDYVLSWGPLVLGHAHPRVVEALERAVTRGTSYGAPTPLEVELARVITGSVPSIEMLRLVSSGTEATMSAVRLARAFTGRDKVVKFAGGYHGHADAFLVQAGSGVSTFGLPDSPGVTAASTSDTLTCAFNDLGALESLFGTFEGQIAAVIVEPLMANMGFIMPRDGFLAGVQALCRKSGALLILDEVITGFRLALNGAQGAWGLEPDLTCLGKVIGGGLPLGAYGGSRAIMEMVAPAGPVYQAGTLSGNPLATTAGLATLRTLLEPGVFASIEDTTRTLAEGIGKLADEAGIPVQTGQIGTIFGFFFLKEPGAKIFDAASAKMHVDTERYSRFFHLMLERGVYFAPSSFEVAFASAVHGEAQVEATLQAVEESFRQLIAR